MADPLERGILFSARLVLAILAGRKTQTRRVLRPALQQSVKFHDCDEAKDAQVTFAAQGHSGPGWYVHCSEYPDEGSTFLGACPYGRPGDRLWVRETWRPEERAADLVDGIRFRADDAFVPIENTREAADRWLGVHGGIAVPKKAQLRWRPTIHMPRWASRLTLDVTEVRVQRLWNISEEDARAEGMTSDVEDLRALGHLRGADAVRAVPSRLESARDRFRHAWNEINGRKCRWEDAEAVWVWVVSFRRVEAAGKAVANG
jgi:hypothetical protein